MELQKLLMKRNGLDPEMPVAPRFHSPLEPSVRGIIEAYPCPEERQQYVGKLLLETAPELHRGLEMTRIAKENRLATNSNEVARLDLSHVEFRS